MRKNHTTYIQHNRLVIALLSAFILSACQKSTDEAPIEKTTSAGNTQEEAKAPIVKLADKKPSYDANVIKFEGFGPAAFGSNEEAVRQAWGRPLLASKPATGATCYYLYKEVLPQLSNTHQRGIAFMFEDGQFVRYDVDDTSQVAPGGIIVGDSMATVQATHAGHIETQPHKYIEGAHTLIVSPPNSGSTRLIFEIDAQNTVINWRIGVTPQVYYVEGCS